MMDLVSLPARHSGSGNSGCSTDGEIQVYDICYLDRQNITLTGIGPNSSPGFIISVLVFFFHSRSITIISGVK
jgi:hypothetical protein